MVVGWTAVTETGGSPITGYKVMFNQGPITDTYIEFETVDSTTFTSTITPVSTGEPYKVKIVATNRLIHGPDSTELTIYAATIP